VAERVIDWKNIGRIAAGATISFMVWKIMQWTIGHHIDRYATRRIEKKYGNGNGNGNGGTAEGAGDSTGETQPASSPDASNQNAPAGPTNVQPITKTTPTSTT